MLSNNSIYQIATNPDTCASSLLLAVTVLSMDENCAHYVLAATAINICVYFVGKSLVDQQRVSKNVVKVAKAMFNFLNLCIFEASVSRMARVFESIGVDNFQANTFSKSLALSNAAFLTQITDDISGNFDGNQVQSYSLYNSPCYLLKHSTKLVAYSLKIYTPFDNPLITSLAFHVVAPAYENFIKWRDESVKYNSKKHFAISSLYKSITLVIYDVFKSGAEYLQFSKVFPSPHMVILDIGKAVLKEVGEQIIDRNF